MTGRKAKRTKRTASLAERLAGVLLLLKRGDGTPLIPVEKHNASAKEILSSVAWDHRIPLAIGGSDTAKNFSPLTEAEHATKTKADIATIAKSNRLREEQKEFRRKMLAKAGNTDEQDKERDENDRRSAVLGNRGKRPKQKMKGRGFQGWRAFDGTIRWKRDKDQRKRSKS